MDPSSFRDPDSRVVVRGEDVLRILSEQGLADYRAFADSPLFDRSIADGRLVGTELLGDGFADMPHLPAGPPAGVLRHERIPFVSYPYEWTFGMLRDAALLQLGLMRDALEEGLILKDATPYNVQFRGAQPVFIDVGSFERVREGEPWAGYRQFCMQFLYPLMLTAYKGTPHQPWLRGSLEGIGVQEMRSMLSFRDRFRRGTLYHVFLHARLEGAQAGTRDVKSELRKAGFNSELIRANVRKLEKLVAGLERPGTGSDWSDYSATTVTPRRGRTPRRRSFARSWRPVRGAGSGTLAATTVASHGWPPSAQTTSWRSTPMTLRSRASTAPCAATARATSFRSR